MMRIFIFIGLLLVPVSIYAAGDSMQVQLNVEGCNNNSICEAVIGEDALSCPNDCAVSNAGGGNVSGSYPIPSSTDFFYNVSTVNGTNRITITWQSTIPTLSLVRWGLTQEFKDGSIASTEFVKDHRVDLTNLAPGSFYYFTIDSRDAYNHASSLPYRMVFTLPLPDTTPPQNPSAFTALSSDKGILLHWTNPTDDDFSSVRITRNTDHYHSSPFIGRLVYEGRGMSFLDKEVKENTTYYYAVYARDKKGNYSSGTATSGKYQVQETLPPPTEEQPQPPVVTPVEQNQEIPFTKFTVSHGDVITITVPASTLSPGTGDLWVNIIGKTGGISAQYLFSYNQETGTFNASIPSTNPGTFHAVVMAYKQGAAVRVSTGTVTVPFVATEHSAIEFPDVTKLLSIGIPLILLALLLLFRRYFFTRK